MALKAVAAPSAVDLQQVLQTEAEALQKGLDASILDIRQAAETFDSTTALQQVCIFETKLFIFLSHCRTHASAFVFAVINVNSWYNAGSNWSTEYSD